MADDKQHQPNAHTTPTIPNIDKSYLNCFRQNNKQVNSSFNSVASVSASDATNDSDCVPNNINGIHEHGQGKGIDISQEELKAYFESFPPGYRFCPLDSELIVDYLRKKINDEPLPPHQIIDVNLYKYNPDKISEKYPVIGEEGWYFFTPRDKKYLNGTRPNRAAGTGYWKATGADKSIKFDGKTVGFRKALVFYEGKPPKGQKTKWIMHEFRVNAPQRKKSNEKDMRLDDYVLCRIYKKTDKSRRSGQQAHDHAGYEINNHLGSPTSSVNETDENCIDYDLMYLQDEAPEISQMQMQGGVVENGDLKRYSDGFESQPDFIPLSPPYTSSHDFSCDFLKEDPWNVFMVTDPEENYERIFDRSDSLDMPHLKLDSRQETKN